MLASIFVFPTTELHTKYTNEGDTEAEVKATHGFNSIDSHFQRKKLLLPTQGWALDRMLFPQVAEINQLLGDKLTTSGSFYSGSTNALQ